MLQVVLVAWQVRITGPLLPLSLFSLPLLEDFCLRSKIILKSSENVHNFRIHTTRGKRGRETHDFVWVD